jgi:hypothetical protein
MNRSMMKYEFIDYLANYFLSTNLVYFSSCDCHECSDYDFDLVAQIIAEGVDAFESTHGRLIDFVKEDNNEST